MGYYDIFYLFENQGWEERIRRDSIGVEVLQGHLVCPQCLRPFTRARWREEGEAACHHCGCPLTLKN